MADVILRAASRFMRDSADGLASFGGWAADHVLIVAGLAIVAGLLLAEAVTR